MQDLKSTFVIVINYILTIFIGAILDEVGLHQLTSKIPSSIQLKNHVHLDISETRDPTRVAPKNTIQIGEDPWAGRQFNEEITQDDQSTEKQGTTRSIYQALKRGIRRLSSIRRNNSA